MPTRSWFPVLEVSISDSESIHPLIYESNTVQDALHNIYFPYYLYDNQKRLWETCAASHDQEVFLKGGFAQIWCKDLK